VAGPLAAHPIGEIDRALGRRARAELDPRGLDERDRRPGGVARAGDRDALGDRRVELVLTAQQADGAPAIAERRWRRGAGGRAELGPPRIAVARTIVEAEAKALADQYNQKLRESSACPRRAANATAAACASSAGTRVLPRVRDVAWTPAPVGKGGGLAVLGRF
jgi:hypothetical protein